MNKSFLKIPSIALLLFMVISIFTGCTDTTKQANTVTKVKLNEVTRSVFYAPVYAAINEGFFKDEGLELDISIGQGADKTMQEVLSGSSDIGFCGPEQVIYIYNQKRDNYPVLFAQLTQRDGSFLMSRKEEANFQWSSLKGKTVLGGRPGGVPEMTFEYVLKQNGLKPGTDVHIITNIAFAAAPGAFKGGTGEYGTIFEPSASMLEKDKAGYIVASVGASAGTIPYTCYFTTKSYMDKNPDILQRFTNALYKGQLWVSSKSDAEVANAIKSFFPGVDLDILTKVVKNYRAINAFATDPLLKQDDLSRLMDIIQSYDPKLIQERPPYNKIVNTTFAQKAISSVK